MGDTDWARVWLLGLFSSNIKVEKGEHSFNPQAWCTTSTCCCPEGLKRCISDTEWTQERLSCLLSFLIKIEKGNTAWSPGLKCYVWMLLPWRPQALQDGKLYVISQGKSRNSPCLFLCPMDILPITHKNVAHRLCWRAWGDRRSGFNE